MNKLYVWWPHRDRNAGFFPHIDVGHASLDISLNQGVGRAEYVSWWPAPGSTGYNPAGSGLSRRAFMDDCVSEGTQSAPQLPYRTVVFGGLDEDKMRARWQAIKRTGNYQMYFNNCAATVADVLRAGGSGFGCRSPLSHGPGDRVDPVGSSRGCPAYRWVLIENRAAKSPGLEA